MLVWSKIIASDQENYYEDRFLGMGQTNAVIKQLASSNRLRVEVFLDNQNEANHLIDEFGGKINKLENIDWAKKNSISNRPLIKIRDQIIVSDNSNPTHLKDIKNKYPNKKIIAIPAALAFGTGDHATTSTCLRMVVDISKKYKKEKRNWSLFDIGLGTGILAISARLMGAHEVEGFDFDPNAITIANRNININSIDNIRVYEKDLFDWFPSKDKTWDVITANIFANVLNPNLNKIWNSVAANGHLLLSGVLKEHHESVIKTSNENGMPEPNIHLKGKWVSFHYKKDS